jgi:antirestriction protein
MFKKLMFVFVTALTTVSCQFTETMILNEDGSGSISISMDMKEMMAFGGMTDDSTQVKVDTTISMKDFLVEKQDSISTLSEAEQERLRKIENFSFRTFMDPDTNEMYFDVYTHFSNVEEANELMNAFEGSGDFMQGLGSDTTVENDPNSGGAMAVKFEFKNGKFKRDAYIKDKAKHKVQMDSLNDAESFMSSMTYKLKYTFPRKIVKSSVEEAKFSMDGKTIEIQRTFLEYLKDPDVLDLEVELEN